MVNERRDWQEGRGDGGRTDRDRESRVNPPRLDDIRAALLQIGVDIYSVESVEDFATAIEYAKERRDRYRQMRENRRTIIVGAVSAFFAGVAWPALQWLMSKLSFGGHGQ